MDADRPDPAPADEPALDGAAADDAPNLTRQTVGGLRWTYFGVAVSAALQLVYTSIINRLLDDTAFGLLAGAQVVLAFGNYATELGLGAALIQRKELSRDDIRAAFTASAALGVALAAALALAAPLVARLIDAPDVTAIVRVLALALALNGLTLVAGNLLARDLRFKELALIGIGAYAVGYLGVGITAAALGAGVWSLVAAALTQQAVGGLAALVLARHPVRPLLAGRRLAGLYGFGGRVSLIQVLEYMGNAATVVVIGRRAGTGPLGQYNRAALVIDLPMVHLSTGLSGVLFPAMSRVQEDRARITRAYLVALRGSGGLLLPIAAGVAVAAPQIVEVLLGPGWDTAASLLPFLAGAAAMAVLSHYGGIVAEALAALNVKLALQGAYVVGLVAGLVAVPSGDLRAYAIVLLTAEVARQLAYAAFMGRLLGISLAETVATYRVAGLASAGVAAAIWAWTTLAGAVDLALAPTFAGQVAVGAVTLGALAAWGPLRTVRHTVRDQLAVAGMLGGDGVGTRVARRLLTMGDARPGGTGR